MTMLTLRQASLSDCDLLYRWANDPVVRANSYQTSSIPFEEHLRWFGDKLRDASARIYMFAENDVPAGQVRIEKKPNETVISISIDEHFRGKSLASRMVEMACDAFFSEMDVARITAYIKTTNVPSYKAFLKAAFLPVHIEMVNGVESHVLAREKNTLARQSADQMK